MRSSILSKNQMALRTWWRHPSSTMWVHIRKSTWDLCRNWQWAMKKIKLVASLIESNGKITQRFGNGGWQIHLLQAHEHFVNTHRNSELNSRSVQDNLVWSFDNVVWYLQSLEILPRFCASKSIRAALEFMYSYPMTSGIWELSLIRKYQQRYVFSITGNQGATIMLMKKYHAAPRTSPKQPPAMTWAVVWYPK